MFKNLKNIFLLTVPLCYLHFLEEYITLTNHIGAKLNFDPQSFIQFEFGYLFVLTAIAILVKIKKFPLFLILPFGFFYIFQLEHLYHTIQFGMYYPGLITGIMLNILGGFFWKEAIMIGIKAAKRGYFFLSSSR